MLTYCCHCTQTTCKRLLKTNGEGVNDYDRVLNLSIVELANEERDDDRSCEAICDIGLIAPQDHEDAKRPGEDTKVHFSHSVEESLAKVEIKEQGRHAESESTTEGADRGTEVRNIFS